GIAFSRWGVRTLVALAPPDLPRLNEVHVDGRVLAVALLVSLGVGLAFGLVPALRFGRTAPGGVLKDHSRGATESRENARLRSWLIACQVGLSALLLVTGGLFLKSLVRVLHADKGFTAERVLAISVPLEGGAYADKTVRNAFYEEALRR